MKKTRTKVNKEHKKYWRTWLEEKDAINKFLVIGGFPKDHLTGKQGTKATSCRVKKSDLCFHHQIKCNGSHPSGRANRVRWIERDLAIVVLVRKDTHDLIHGEGLGSEELKSPNNFITGEIN